MLSNHVSYIVYKIFRNTIESEGFSDGVKEQLTSLLILFGLWYLKKDNMMLFDSGDLP